MWRVWSSFVFREKKPSSSVTVSMPFWPLTTAPIIGSPVSLLITRAFYIVCAFKLTVEVIANKAMPRLKFFIMKWIWVTL